MPPDVAAGAKHLVGVSQPIVDRLNPWDKPRRPPPPKGNVRMTFLASDGLYFAEETLSAVERDPRGGEVYSWAVRL